MNIDELRRSDEAFVRRHEYDDGTVVIADLGAGSVDAAVDVVGETVIVVQDDDDTFELTVEGDPEAFIRNGVLTIEVDR